MRRPPIGVQVLRFCCRRLDSGIRGGRTLHRARM